MNQQIPRLLVVFAVLGVGLIGAREYLTPPTYGQYGHYRAAAIKTISSRAPRFAGAAVCGDCHADIVSMRAAGNHRSVNCEVCHGPAQIHADSLEPKPRIPQPRQFCPVCHAYDPSRPTGFPQIDPVAHNPGIVCTKCHNPHAPVPPRTPEECNACHGQIAHAKAVSKHARLACTTCHDAPEQHKATPHAVRPTVPGSRFTCTRCHAEPDSAKSIAAPQINATTHNPRYACWQCHYPHNPRAL